MASLFPCSPYTQFRKPSIADGLFEVFGVKGAAHLARIQSKVSHGGIRLGQGKHMKIVTTRDIPAQVDGMYARIAVHK